MYEDCHGCTPVIMDERAKKKKVQVETPKQTAILTVCPLHLIEIWENSQIILKIT